MDDAKPALKRVRFVFEALCEPDVNTDELDLQEVLKECHAGDMSGRSLGHTTKELTLAQARRACDEHGTDPEFFRLPLHDVGTKVWWTDPADDDEDDCCSGWYTIKAWKGDFYQMVNDAGSEVEAYEREVSLKKPKKGKS